MSLRRLFFVTSSAELLLFLSLLFPYPGAIDAFPITFPSIRNTRWNQLSTTELHSAVTAASEWYCPPPEPAKEVKATMPPGVTADVQVITSHIEFEEFLGEDDRLCVVNFHAAWCKSCQKFGLLYHKLATQKADWKQSTTGQHVDRTDRPNGQGDIRMASVEWSANTALCQSLGIKRLPTVCIYADGQKIDSMAVGPSKFSLVRDAIRKYLAYTPKELELAAALEETKSKKKASASKEDANSLAVPKVESEHDDESPPSRFRHRTFRFR